MEKQPGETVSTKSGKIGWTFAAKGVMNGKVSVFVVESGERATCGVAHDRVVRYSGTGMICDLEGLVVIGEIR